MATKKKSEPIPAEVPKTKTRRRKPVAAPGSVLTAPKTPTPRILENQWADPKWIQRAMEWQKRVTKANELYQSLQPAFSLAQSLDDAFRISDRFNQLARIAKSFPTESELEALSEERNKAALILAKRGWFIPLGMTLGEHKTLFKKIAEGKEGQAEDLVEKHLEAKLAKVEAKLVTQFPDLAAMLKEAFELHHNGKYFGSIALFLSLSDGIGQRIFQVSPVSSAKEKLSKIRKFVEPHRDKDFLIGWAWNVIGEVLPVNDRTDNLHNYIDPLKRHAVLHGLCTDHGTKRNSLKAVSWLNHVSQFRNLLAARDATATDA